MSAKNKLSLKTTSVRTLSDLEAGAVGGGYTSIAACGDDPTNRPCITVNAATGCPTGVPITPSTPAATCGCNPGDGTGGTGTGTGGTSGRGTTGPVRPA